MFNLFFLFSIVKPSLPLISSDLKSKKPLLIFIYYERPNLSCPLCYIIREQFDDLKHIEKRIINFYDNPILASRFFCIFFPVLIILDHQRIHHIDIYADKEEIQKIIDNKNWSHSNCMKFGNNPNCKFILFYSYFTYFYFSIMRVLFKIADLVPNWIVSVLIGFVLACMVIILGQLIKKELKEKDD
ncbi:hypothetical protein GVAV_000388 [Gurleya vavrai]